MEYDEALVPTREDVQIFITENDLINDDEGQHALEEWLEELVGDMKFRGQKVIELVLSDLSTYDF